MPDLEGATHRDVIAGGLRMHVAEAGPADAPPVLLVHGWPQHWWIWRRVIGDLARDHRCLMPDLRGHGWSEAPATGYEKEQLASDLLALLDALELNSVTYAGHDWGSFAGMLLAIRAPERVSGLLAMSVPHLWPAPAEQRNPKRLAVLAYQLPLSAPLLGRRLMRAGMTPRIIMSGAKNREAFSPEDLEIYDARMRTPEGARTTVGLYRTFLTRELVPILRGRYENARLDVPARLLMGEHDPIGANSDLGGYERNAPRMEVEWVPGAGHFLPEEAPEVVIRRIRELA